MKKLPLMMAAALTTCFLTVPTFALEYTIQAPDPYSDYANPTTIPVYDVDATAKDPNVDRSKDAALVPPFFGTAAAALPLSTAGQVPLTAAAPSAVTVTAGAALPDLSPTYPKTKFTALTKEAYTANGSIGTLSIPKLNLSVNIYEGTSAFSMAKGAAHFSETSIWEGNVALAGHNRGTNNIFGSIHTLKAGDKITLTTVYGARLYTVYRVEKISETDTSCLSASSDNLLTLVTCVKNQSQYRYVVQARESA